jgi:hypothetical protein
MSAAATCGSDDTGSGRMICSRMSSSVGPVPRAHHHEVAAKPAVAAPKPRTLRRVAARASGASASSLRAIRARRSSQITAPATPTRVGRTSRSRAPSRVTTAAMTTAPSAAREVNARVCRVRATAPMLARRARMTRAIPTQSAVLSLVPKACTARVLSQSGVRSTKAAPTAARGMASPPTAPTALSARAPRAAMANPPIPAVRPSTAYPSGAPRMPWTQTHDPRTSAKRPARARKALPRCDIAFFCSGVSSAAVRPSSSSRIGS